MSRTRLVLIAALVVVVLGGLYWSLRPGPVLVDVITVTRAPIQVTVDAEGITRVRNAHLVTAPISGNLNALPVEVGEGVVAGQTVLARLQPAEPALLDARARAQAEAAVAEAEAALRLAEVQMERVRADLAHAENQLARNRALADQGTIPRRVLEDSEANVTSLRAALNAASGELELRRATLSRANAQLMAPDTRIAEGTTGACCIEVMARHSGTVLAMESRSARMVQAGEVLMVVGDLSDLEIEVDLLSADAVRLPPDARAVVERWGGEAQLDAQVRTVEPRGFTRVSALGIEEQRVRVHLDFASPPDARPGLGDAYRVFVRIVTWESEDALQVPISALFRDGPGWAVYRVIDGYAVHTPVTPGPRTQAMAVVTDGLRDGEQVIAYPGDRVSPGALVAPRGQP